MFSKVCSQTSGLPCPRSLRNSSPGSKTTLAHRPPACDDDNIKGNFNREHYLTCCHDNTTTNKLSISKYQKKSRGTKNLIIYRKIQPKVTSKPSKTVACSSHVNMCPHHHYIEDENVFWNNCNNSNHGERVHLTDKSTNCKCAHKDTYTSYAWPFSEGREDQEDCKSCDTNRKSYNNNNNDYLFNAIYELLLANENCLGNDLVQGTQNLTTAYHISRTLYKYLLFFKSPVLLPPGAHCTNLAKCTRRTIVVN